MSSPVFAQPERRSYAVPIVLTLVAVAIAVAMLRFYFPPTTIEIEPVRTELLPTSTAYKSDSIELGLNQTANELFIASTIKVTNGRKVPIFLDNFSLTLTDMSGAQLTAKAATKEELANIETSFPKLAPLAVTPLLRDTQIDPGKSAQGTLVFSLAIPQKIWDERKVATITVDVYHDVQLSQDIR